MMASVTDKPMSDWDKKYQIEEDYRTMKRMGEIQSDSKRLAAAIKYGEDCVQKDQKALSAASSMMKALKKK